MLFRLSSVSHFLYLRIQWRLRFSNPVIDQCGFIEQVSSMWSIYEIIHFFKFSWVASKRTLILEYRLYNGVEPGQPLMS